MFAKALTQKHIPSKTIKKDKSLSKSLPESYHVASMCYFMLI